MYSSFFTKSLPKVLLIVFLFCSPSFAVSVKFSVDMANHISKGLFNPANDKVFLRGDFNNWAQTTEMQRLDGGNVYSVTVSLSQNTTYQYKYFINTPGAANNGWESDTVGLQRNGNRVAMTRTDDVDLAVMHFNNSNMPVRKETAHFLFYCDPQDENVLNDMASRLEKDYARIVVALEAGVGSKIQIEIYKDIKTHHTATGDISGADWGVGSAFGKTLIKMLSPNKPTAGYTYEILLSTASHEFTHCVVAWKMTVPVKAWLNEGCAMYFADNPFVRNKDGVKYNINKLGFKPTLTFIEDHFSDGGYEFSSTVADFVATKFGTHALASFVGNAIFSTLGFSSQEAFETAWHQFLDQYYLNTPGKIVSKEKAQVIAVNWYRHWNPNHPEDNSVSEYFPFKYDGQDVFHVFNFKSGGWVVVPSGERMAPITAYNFSSKANDGFFLWWVYQTHLEDIPTQQTAEQWSDIFNNDFSSFSNQQVQPLMTTRWHQWWPYNANYPRDPVFYPEENGFYRTGCLPLAAVQVLKFWNYPDKGKGKINVNDPVWGTFTRDFSKVVFDWKNMPDFLDKDITLPVQAYSASAALVENVALSTVNFGASMTDFSSAFATYWKYSPNADIIEKRSFTDSEWAAFCKRDLDKGRPLMTTGSPDVDGQAGHAFAVDGYQAGDYFHCNFGWADLNGYMNGYYQLNNLGSHLRNNNVLLNLQPAKSTFQFGGPYTIDDSTVLLMHFNGGLKDEVSNTNASANGTGISFAPSDSLGLGQCLRIDNSTSSKQSYLTLPYNSKLNLSGDWTIEAWVYVSSWKAPHTMYPYIVTKPGSSWWDVNYSLKLISGDNAAIPEYGLSAVSNTTEMFYNSKNTIEAGKWYHLAYIRKTGTRNIKLLIYDKNKELIFFRTQPYENTEVRKPRLNVSSLFIGWLGQDYNTYFDGFIDELRISNVARDFESGSQLSPVSVWPGDADNDGKVKAGDVLPLGFFYGKTGPLRLPAGQGSEWKACLSAPWDIYKSTFADCNGDGLVDARDIMSIGFNYNKTTPAALSPQYAPAGHTAAKESEERCPGLNVKFIKDDDVIPDIKQLSQGDIFTVSISVNNAKDLLGLSFDLNWDSSVIDVPMAEPNLKAGSIWQKDALFVNKLFNEEGRYELGITNISGNPINHDGEVLAFRARIIKPGLDGRFGISQAQWMDKAGNKSGILAGENLTSADNGKSIVKDYSLTNYPNPFNPSTNIRFSLPSKERVYIKIYTSLGREAAVIVNGGQFQPGEYELHWDASGYPSGLYICRLVAGNKTISRKILIVK